MRIQNYHPEAQWKVKTSPVSQDSAMWTPQKPASTALMFSAPSVLWETFGDSPWSAEAPEKWTDKTRNQNHGVTKNTVILHISW